MQLNTKKYDAFCSHIFDYACLKRKVYRYRRGSKLWKNCTGCIKNIFENNWWEDAYPSSCPPGSASGNKLQNLKKVWHILVTWQLAPSILFFFTKRQSQKGEHSPMIPPKYDPAHDVCCDNEEGDLGRCVVGMVTQISAPLLLKSTSNATDNVNNNTK